MGEAESAYRRSKAIRRPQWSILYESVQKVYTVKLGVLSHVTNKKNCVLGYVYIRDVVLLYYFLAFHYLH